MSPELNSEWRPSASLNNLRVRAGILKKIRRFFEDRSVLEVETPLISQYTITDRHISSLAVSASNGHCYYLQTSPEYAMKRLLAAGVGCIYQICKAFRAEENGHLHNSEFTMLEWYRLGFTHHQLMDEIDQLLKIVLDTSESKRMTYTHLFREYLNINIHESTLSELQQLIQKKGWMTETENLDQDTCLQLLMSHGIEPQLGFESPLFVYDFPSTQAALAKLSQTQPPMAERFELYIQGLEIANGFHELTDSTEQEQRFLRDQQQRQINGEPIPAIDPRLLSALKHGLPHCSGVALGVDRLIMLATAASHIEEVVTFPWARC